MAYITVFTPVYNRAHLISNLYQSLVSQSRHDFEWIVVDDASSDDIDVKMKEIMSENSYFPITYYKQEHGGKHRAINKALDLAKGDYFFIVDSDDLLIDNSIERVYSWLEEIDCDKSFAGVSGLRMYPDGKIIGSNISDNYIDCTNLQREQNNLLGDKAEVYRTSILREHKFPEFDDEFFVTEAVVWDRIAMEGYKVRWYNEPIYVCEYLDGGLSKGGANSTIGHVKNYQGYCYYIKQLITIYGLFGRPRLFSEYLVCAKEMNKTCKEISSDLDISYMQAIMFRPCILLGFVRSGFRKVLRRLGVTKW